MRYPVRKCGNLSADTASFSAFKIVYIYYNISLSVWFPLVVILVLEVNFDRAYAVLDS